MSEHYEANVSTNGTPSLSERVRELRLTGKVDGAKKSSAGGNSWLPWALCILLALAWGGMGIRWYRTGGPAATGPQTNGGGNPTEGSSGAGAVKSIQPTTNPSEQKAQVESDEVVLEGKGNIIPSHQISVSPVDVQGRIIELNIEEGKRFNEGDILARIDPTRYQADFDIAEASAGANKARLDELKVSRDLQLEQAEFEVQSAKRTMEKSRMMYETNKRNYETRTKSISDIEYLQSEKDYLGYAMQVGVSERKRDLIKGQTRDEQIRALENEWKSSLARARQAKWFLDNCTIKSPVTGVVLSKKAEKGNLINPVVGTVPTGLCDIADLSDLEIEIKVGERDIRKFFIGQACNIKPDAFQDRIYEGYVQRAMPTVIRAEGKLAIRVKIIVPPTEEQSRYLKPEMEVTVDFLNKMSTDPIWLKQQDAVYPNGLPIKPKEAKKD